ncbi:MAG: hypothetical protein HYS07_05110 [Chlamydiae bacterium]|nr:hypothetical protein [Chlamydiota bacterium]MBI3276132.1 hypothetical protein [Chlamydiota bacterium]
MNIYVELTERFNEGKLRAVLSSGQAVVLHHLAVMSKDGDWILKEELETLGHVLQVLSQYGAQYRFGAPLDVRWLSGGWSSHLEFGYNNLRVRTDFVTRPPRIPQVALDRLWVEQEGKDIPFVDIKTLIEIKETNREKDYAVIGELARMLSSAKDQMLYSRSARDIMMLAAKHPEILLELVIERPLLGKISQGRLALEQALDEEKRHLIHANEARLEAYMKAAEEWSKMWIQVEKEVRGYPLLEAHHLIATRASGVLPFSV